jgi:hypothetical protein
LIHHSRLVATRVTIIRRDKKITFLFSLASCPPFPFLQ